MLRSYHSMLHELQRKEHKTYLPSSGVRHKVLTIVNVLPEQTFETLGRSNDLQLQNHGNAPYVSPRDIMKVFSILRRRVMREG